MPNPLPWFPFHIDDWTTSIAVKAMSLAERGLYIECLIVQWRLGYVPDDLRLLARAIGCDTREIRHAWGRVRPQFEHEGETKLYNSRLEVERKSKDKISQVRSESAKASSKSTSFASVRASDSGCVSDSLSQTTKNPEGEDPTRAREVSPPPVAITAVQRSQLADEEFQSAMGMWLSLGVAMSETDTRKCAALWVALSIEEQLTAYKHIQAQYPNWRTCATHYIPRPWNYLRDKQWERKSAVPERRAMSRRDVAHDRAAARFLGGKS